MKRIVLAFLVAALCASANAFELQEVNLYAGPGKSLASWHGQATFRSIEFGIIGRSALVARVAPKVQVGASVTYSDIHQPRSWFGHLYGDGDDWVRGEWAYAFVRRAWRENASVRPYAELGTGPMWSNRRVPAATSRFNFNSQAGLGVQLFANSHPLYVVYRFSHISNLVFGPRNPGKGKRNPGWDVNSVLIGTRLHRAR